MAKKTIQNIWAQDATNKQTFTQDEVKAGIVYKGPVVSPQLNGISNDLYIYTDQLQRACTAWNPLKKYEIGDVVEVRAIHNSEQLIAKFACSVAGISAPLVNNGATSFILDSDKNVCIFNITDNGTKTLKAYCGSSWVFLKDGYSGNYLLDSIYPVGSIYISVSKTFNPSTVWGGTWTKIEEGRYLRATTISSSVDTKIEAGLPDHTHTYSYKDQHNGCTVGYYIPAGSSWASGTTSGATSTNGGDAIWGKSKTVTPASINVYMWRRDA